MPFTKPKVSNRNTLETENVCPGKNELRQTANMSETKKYRGALPITERYLRCAGLRIPSAGRCHPVRISEQELFVMLGVFGLPIAEAD